jgi:phosphomannomutase/phosphoglucomutase
MNPFKAYDIRGQVPQELNTRLAYRIGQAYAQVFRPRCLVVGRDARLESPALAQALSEGLNAAGVDVIDIGLCGTEEVYFQTFQRQGDGVDGGIMVTASHNPKGYNGMKLVGPGARPISGDNGLLAIRDLALADSPLAQAAQPGQTRAAPDKGEYIQHLLGYIDTDALRPLKILANPGNGPAGLVLRLLQPHLPFVIDCIQEEPDGQFPQGVPNPLLPENRSLTAQAVVASGADLGIAWDGDFDRCFLFDAQGRFIEGYYLVGLLAEMMLAKHPGSRIIHDPRLTWNTIEQVQQAGGVPIQCKTGHAFIKQRMREEDAVYGGEMSAHHYFRDFAYCDSGMIPWLLIAELISRSGQSLAQLVEARMAAYPCSGEINYRVSDAAAVIERVRAHFAPQALHQDSVDGLSLEFAHWRFNLRSSNTEPLLRLNLETQSQQADLGQCLAELEGLIL